MKPAWYQIAWSYIRPISFETCGSLHNEYLEVALHRGQWQLLTNNAIYSFGNRYDNFRIVFERLFWERFTGQEVLLLGLGLGSIPYMLEKHFDKKLCYTAVEIDDVVLALAHKYVLQDLKHPMDIICGDAEVYLESAELPYDLICLDVFQDAQIPSFFLTNACLEACSRLLSPQGLLLSNMLNTEPEHQKIAMDYLKRAMVFFPQAELQLTGSNYVLVSDRTLLRAAEPKR